MSVDAGADFEFRFDNDELTTCYHSGGVLSIHVPRTNPWGSGPVCVFGRFRI